MIVLHGPGESEEALEIAREDIHFAFHSGSLTYDCVSCGSTCCKGHGYLLNIHQGPELDTHLQASPLVRFFLAYDASEQDQPRIRMGNMPPGCFFLQQDGACGIHRQHGYPAKPETCRLFPFNNIARVDKHLIVAPHLSLCPLEVAERPPDPRSDHRSLLDDLSLRGLSNQVPELTPSVDVPLSDVFGLEAEIRNACGSAPAEDTYLACAARQMAATLPYVQAPGAVPAADPGDVLRAFVDRAIAILGTSIELSDPQLTRVLTAATPWLRIQLLFHSEQGLQQRRGFSAIDAGRVPLMMTAVYLVARLARQAGMDRVTIQTVNQLAERFQDLAYLLAHADLPMVWQEGEDLDSPKTEDVDLRFRYMRTVRALSRRKQERRPRPLTDVLCEFAPATPLERARFLVELAQVLKYRIVPLALERPPAGQSVVVSR